MFLLVSLGVALSCGPAARSEEVEAVSSRVSDDYVRARLPDGSFRPEAYTFAKGGYWSEGGADYSIDKIQFMDVARTIAGPLAARKYVPARVPNATRLLVVVYWGTTFSFGHASSSMAYQNLQGVSQALSAAQMDSHGVSSSMSYLDDQMDSALALVGMENHVRDKKDAEVKAMLGYDSWWDKYPDFYNRTTFISPLMEHRRQDMIDELEEGRYFVVLMAYDFQLMWKQKKHKLLWETRFSIRRRGNEFDKQLASMALDASKYFGQDSHGLVHSDMPVGRVEVGDIRSLGPVPEK